MVLLAALLDVLFITVAFGGRTLVQRRLTGDAGWRLGRPHSGWEAAARALLVGSAVALTVALVRADRTPPVPAAVLAAALALAAIALVTVAQLQMGASWRIGLDPDERTALVRTGVYSLVRNPIYSGMAAFAFAQAVLIPSAWSLGAAVAMAIGVEIQVRWVEEPYLAHVHGQDYRSWATRSGRFVPRLG